MLILIYTNTWQTQGDKHFMFPHMWWTPFLSVIYVHLYRSKCGYRSGNYTGAHAMGENHFKEEIEKLSIYDMKVEGETLK